jgi:hypothetical protein
MGAFTNSENIRGNKSTPPPEIKSIFEYLESFIEVYNDPLMNKIYASILKTKFISNDQIEIIKKRYDAIPPKEIKNPHIYFEKYFYLLADLRSRCHSSPIGSELVEKGLNLIDFYTKFGYLTKKQISLTNVIIRTTTPTSTPLSPPLKIIAEHLTFLGMERAYSYSIAYSSGSAISEFLFQTIEDKNKEKTKEKIKEEIKNRTEKTKSLEAEENSPTRFLSLAEMRAALSS